MKASTIRWHLARDNQTKLARFCEKHRIEQSAGEVYLVEDKRYFKVRYEFDNGGHIEAELRAGEPSRGFGVADHFQVVSYDMGQAV